MSAVRPQSRRACAAAAIAIAALHACGARSGVRAGSPSEPALDAAVLDASRPDGSEPAADAFPSPDAAPVTDAASCTPLDDQCTSTEMCGDGDDDDCDGRPDDGCVCVPGEVQSCFSGPPGRRGVGACTDGSQVCTSSNVWGPCTGGIDPRAGVCDGTDAACDGCSQGVDCPIDCPTPGDPRIPDGTPFERYRLDGGAFYRGSASSWRWSIEGGPCDQLAPGLRSYELFDSDSQIAIFTPRLSGDYRVTLEVRPVGGGTLSCSWVVHVVAPGVRVEMCYPESELLDLDLFLQRARGTPWYLSGDVYDPSPEVCGWHNCEATIRGRGMRVDWDYPSSPLSECENGPHGDIWRSLGFCGNPRLDIDNGGEVRGLPENINLDAPRDGETFRVMVHNFDGELAHPLVNVYCGGRRVGTFGAAPDLVARFEGVDGRSGQIGAMWRVVDITTRLDPSGALTCSLVQVHPPGATTGYDVTYGEPRY